MLAMEVVSAENNAKMLETEPHVRKQYEDYVAEAYKNLTKEVLKNEERALKHSAEQLR